MNITYREKLVAYLALLSGLSISIVAIYYSVSGLISIFSAAVIPIIIMGVTLEVSKLVATLWLKQNWNIAPAAIKAYLLVAIAILMTITSLGIFGFLAKAHSDQSAPTKDVIDKVAIVDEKIKTQKENIEASRRALFQMDAAVDQTMARSSSEQGAGRAINIRRAQSKERTLLQKEITTAQQEIIKLNEERAPLAQKINSIEAEVGPIKFLAALMYGDNLNNDILEKAVQWVIVLIVSIFDPLAVILLLASQYSFQYFNTVKSEQKESKVDNVGLPLVTDVPPMPIEPTVEIPIEDNFEEKFGLPPVTDVPPMPEIKSIKRSKQQAKPRKAVRYTPKVLTELDVVKAAKRKFKKENPGKTLHEYEMKKDLGVIGKLPWEDDLEDN
jgi:hypothetical protein